MRRCQRPGLAEQTALCSAAALCLEELALQTMTRPARRAGLWDLAASAKHLQTTAGRACAENRSLLSSFMYRIDWPEARGFRCPTRFSGFGPAEKTTWGACCRG